MPLGCKVQGCVYHNFGIKSLNIIKSIKFFHSKRSIYWYHALVSYLMPQGDKEKNGQISRGKWPYPPNYIKIKSAMALYQKNYVMGVLLM